MTDDRSSGAGDIMRYSFLVGLANDGVLDEAELAFIEKLALRDGVIDDEERSVLAALFDRAAAHGGDPEVESEIRRFRKQFSI